MVSDPGDIVYLDELNTALVIVCFYVKNIRKTGFFYSGFNLRICTSSNDQTEKNASPAIITLSLGGLVVACTTAKHELLDLIPKLGKVLCFFVRNVLAAQRLIPLGCLPSISLI